MRPEHKVLARQMHACAGLAMRRYAGTRFMLTAVLLAALPLLLIVIMTVSMRLRQHVPTPAEQDQIFQFLLRTMYLHFVVFFVAIHNGFAIARQDLDDRTLHYILLQPIPRWAVVVSRVIAFAVISGALILGSVWLTYAIWKIGLAGPGGLVRDLLGESRGLVRLLRESGVLMLAMIGYGAIGMLVGSIFKSAVPVAMVWLWEGLLAFLPQALKELTLAHYLQSLLPGALTGQRRLLELLGEPAGTLQSILVIAIVAGAALAMTILVFHFRECVYAEEQQ